MTSKEREKKMKKILFARGAKAIRIIFSPHADEKDTEIISNLYYSRQIVLSEIDLEKIKETGSHFWKVNKEARTLDIILGPHVLRGWFALRMSSVLSDVEEIR